MIGLDSDSIEVWINSCSFYTVTLLTAVIIVDLLFPMNLLLPLNLFA